jgi:hypothetical protein
MGWPRRPRDTALAVVFLGICLMATYACAFPGRIFGDEVGRYVNDMRQPLQRLTAWASRLQAFYTDLGRGDPQDVACANNRLADLAAEGESLMADLRRITPPSPIAGTHDRLVSTGEGIVERLTQARTLLCDRGEVAAAKRLLDEAGQRRGDLGQWLQRLTAWLQDG